MFSCGAVSPKYGKYTFTKKIVLMVAPSMTLVNKSSKGKMGKRYSRALIMNSNTSMNLIER